MSVFVCLSNRVSPKLHIQTSQNFLYVNCDHGSVLWRQYNVMYFLFCGWHPCLPIIGQAKVRPYVTYQQQYFEGQSDCLVLHGTHSSLSCTVFWTRSHLILDNFATLKENFRIGGRLSELFHGVLCSTVVHNDMHTAHILTCDWWSTLFMFSLFLTISILFLSRLVCVYFLYFFFIAFAVCCRPSVCNVRTPYSSFRQISTALGTLATRWHPLKISRTSSQGNPFAGAVKYKRVAKYSDFGPIDGYISETVQDRR